MGPGPRAPLDNAAHCLNIARVVLSGHGCHWGRRAERNTGIAARARDMRRQMGLEMARGRALKTATRSFRKSPDDAQRAPIAKLNLPGPKAELRFPIGQASRAFYRRFWPGTGPAEWNDWRWQMRTRIRTLEP